MHNLEDNKASSMMLPINSSTPNDQFTTHRIYGRPRIRGTDYRSVSPIRRNDTTSEDSDASSDNENEQKNASASASSAHMKESHSVNESQSHSNKIFKYSHSNERETQSYSSENCKISSRFASRQGNNTKDCNGAGIPLWTSCVGIIFAIIIVVGFSMSSKESKATSNTVNIKELQDYFPLLSEEIWNALESGINEVKRFNKPSVFLLLYEDEETINHLLPNIAKYATCVLNENCELPPIVLTNSYLTTVKAKTDYGYIIEKYKPELEQKSVMIVKNLDEVPGKVAQVFHSMCDEYTPLVGKTVYFLTIKIENLKKLQKRDLQIVEELLRSNWNDLEDDIFYPLFTRISNMVLRVVPEKSTINVK